MYLLMCKNSIRASFDVHTDSFGECVDNVHVYGLLPIGYSKDSLFKWLESRRKANSNRSLKNYLQMHNSDSLAGFIQLTYSVSINDSFWVKRDADTTTWEQVSPYDNDLNAVRLHSPSPEFSTEGSFPKCWKRENDKLYLYKRGGECFGSKGREPYCEVLASQVYSAFGAGIPYELVTLHGKVASKCRIFTNSSYSFIPFHRLSSSENLREMIEYYKHFPNFEIFAAMLIGDAIVVNVDRHQGNHGCIANAYTNKLIYVSTGFDYNLSLLANNDFESKDDLFEEASIAKGYYKDSFIPVARTLLTQSLRDRLVNMRGITLTLPFYDNRMTEQQVNWLTDLVNYRIDQILK